MSGRPAPVQAVLFDFDGTLADTIPLILASFRHTFSELEPDPVEEAVIRSWIGRPLLDPLEERHPGRGQELVARYREHNLAHHDDLIQGVPGITQVVADLQAEGVPVGIVSSKMADTVRRGMGVVGLPAVDVVVGLHEVTRHKPDPEPLLEGARRLGVDPTACVYVGDAVVDVRAAQSAGMPSIAVTWGAAERERLEQAGADHLVSTAPELAQVLRGMLRR